VTFPGLGDRDDGARLEALLGWIALRPAGSRARDLEGPLRAAAGPADRAATLRGAAREDGIATCDVAKILETPWAPPDAGAGEASDERQGR
jgi:hypothetical protein